MTYYLKLTKSKKSKCTFISINKSGDSSEKKEETDKVYMQLGSVEHYKRLGMDDPVAYFQSEVDRLNEGEYFFDERAAYESEVRSLGYFPIKLIAEKIAADDVVRQIGTDNCLGFDLNDVLMSLVYARTVAKCEYDETFHGELKTLYHPCDKTMDEIFRSLEILGANYEEIIEHFTEKTNRIYKSGASVLYFSYRLYCFDIGEISESPVETESAVGILFDDRQIPVNMKVSFDNDAEFFVMLDELKARHASTGKFVSVGATAINLAQYVSAIIKRGDGYVYPELLEDLDDETAKWCKEYADSEEYVDAEGAILYMHKSHVDDCGYFFDTEDSESEPFYVKEKRVAVMYDAYSMLYDEDEFYVVTTSEKSLSDAEIYNVFRSSCEAGWFFSDMVGDMCCNPEYSKNKDIVKGHFLVSYLSLLFERILRVIIMEDKYSDTDVFQFLGDFRVIRGEDDGINREYANLVTPSLFIDDLADRLNLPISGPRITEEQIEELFNAKI